jgi:DNA-binding protein HU-beta
LPQFEISTTITKADMALLSQENSHMNRKELIDALSTKTGSSKADADRNIAALIEIITATLKKGDNVALVGFGTLEVRKRAARVGRNPATGAELKIKSSKAPAFKAGATLKAAVNGGK